MRKQPASRTSNRKRAIAPPRPGDTPGPTYSYRSGNRVIKPSERTGNVQKSTGQETRPGAAKWDIAEDTARLVLGNALQDFGGVALGLDGGPDGFDHTGLANKKGAADDAHEFASHELLLLP